jgi:two-component system, sporulation sensor kinase E
MTSGATTSSERITTEGHEQSESAGFWEWNVVTNVHTWSNQMYRIWEIDEHAPSHIDTLAERVVESDRVRFMEAMRNARDYATHHDVQISIAMGDGSLRIIDWSVDVTTAQDGTVSRMYGLARDLTKWESLQQHYHSLFDKNPNAILTVDSEGRISDFNTAFVRTLGYAPEELLCKSIFDVWQSGDPAELFRQVIEVEECQSLDGVSMELQSRQGTRLNVTGSITPIVMNGKTLGFHIQLKDATAERDAEKELKHAQQLLLRSEKLSAIGQLAAGLAHEIRNPLTSLGGFVQLLLQNKGPTSKEAEYLHIMQSELKRIEWIVSELLMNAKPRVEQFQWVQPLGLVEDVVSLLQTQALLSSIDIRMESSGNLPEIYGDASQLKQLFINIIKNACEASPFNGEILIRLYCGGRSVVFECLDHGKGIPKHQLSHIGEPFFTTKDTGTGLGMMVSYQIVKRHGGDIHLRSKRGYGTKIRIEFPI